MTVRVAFLITTLLGTIYAAAGLLAPTPTDFLTGITIAATGVIGYGATDWTQR